MNFHIVVIGRLKSSRLPRKALLPLGNSYSIISFLMQRLQQAFAENVNVNLTLLTSNLSSDNDLVNEVSAAYKVFRGSPLNVINRILSADSYFNYNSDYVLRVTADNPFTCPHHIKLLIDFANKNPCVEYAIVPDLNTGLRAELIKLSYLYKVSDGVVNPDSSEYMSFMLDRPDYAKIVYLDPLVETSLRCYCFTVDTLPQYNFVKSIVDKGFTPNSNLEYLFDLSQNCDSAMFDYNRYAKVDNTTVMSYGCSWKKDL